MMYCFDLIYKRRLQRGEAMKRKSSHPLGSKRAASLLRSLEPYWMKRVTCSMDSPKL
jgi:hypothetical protein